MERISAPPLPGWLTRMLPSGVQRYRLDVGGHRMHVMEVGEGRPVLMQHGNPTWGFLYRKVASALAGSPLRVIMPDLLGLGFSDRLPDPTLHQLDLHATWLGALIDELDLSDVIFVGQDWGGPIGLRALADRRERLGGLVVLNTVVSPPRDDFKPTAFHRFANMPIASDVAFRLLGFPQAALWAAQGDRSSIRGAVSRAYQLPLRGWRNNAAPLALARMVPSSFDHPSIEPLRRCQQLVESFDGPSAMVWGDRDPVLGSVRGWVEKLMPRAQVTRTQAGHFLQEEVPDEIAAAVLHVAGELN